MILRCTALHDQVTSNLSCKFHRKDTVNTTLISTKHRAKQLRPRGAPRVQAMSTDLWAFDFDGVVCNSVGESSKSAWKVGIKMPPETSLHPPPDICNSLTPLDCRHRPGNGQTCSAKARYRPRKRRWKARCAQ